MCELNNDFLRELYFLNYFAGQLPVPKIMKTVPPDAKRAGAVLMEHLPGALLTSQEFYHSLAAEIGSELARMHLNRVTRYGDLIDPQLSTMIHGIFLRL